MKYLIYLSREVRPMSEDDLTVLLEQSRSNNLKHDVTGVLLYFEGAFIQVLEGMPNDVDATFKKIEDDARHKNVMKIIDKPLHKRNFPGWSMGFSPLNHEAGEEFMHNIPFEEIMESGNGHRAITVLKTFITTHKILVTC